MSPENIRVQANVGGELLRGWLGAGRDACQRTAEVLSVPRDEPPPEFALRAEVVVQRGLGQPYLLGNIGVAEAVEAPRLGEPFRDIKNEVGGIHRRHGPGFSKDHHAMVTKFRETGQDYLLVSRTGGMRRGLSSARAPAQE